MNQLFDLKNDAIVFQPPKISMEQAKAAIREEAGTFELNGRLNVNIGTDLGEVLSLHKRSFTYRIIFLIIASMLLPALWAGYVVSQEGIKAVFAVTAAIVSLGLITIFIIQSRERLLLLEGGIVILGATNQSSIRWHDVSGILVTMAYSDLQKVDLQRKDGTTFAFDMNWKHRRAITVMVVWMLGNLNAPPISRLSPWSVGSASGRWIRSIMGK